MSIFCKHDYKLISETTTVSKFEHTVNAVYKVAQTSKKIPWQMSCANRKHIQVFKCEKCGKLKRFVDNI